MVQDSSPVMPARRRCSQAPAHHHHAGVCAVPRTWCAPHQGTGRGRTSQTAGAGLHSRCIASCIPPPGSCRCWPGPVRGRDRKEGREGSRAFDTDSTAGSVGGQGDCFSYSSSTDTLLYPYAVCIYTPAWSPPPTRTVASCTNTSSTPCSSAGILSTVKRGEAPYVELVLLRGNRGCRSKG